MANYRLSPNAKDDLERIWFYGLEQWGQAKADRYLQDLFEVIGKIADSPYHYQAIEHKKTGLQALRIQERYDLLSCQRRDDRNHGYPRKTRSNQLVVEWDG